MGKTYVSVEDVRRACDEHGLADWSQLKTGVATGDADRLRKLVGAEAMEISVEEFALGLNVELEHGTMFGDANVTNNHPVLTAKIVLAHLKEDLLYYPRLKVSELQGDLFKAAMARDGDRAALVSLKLADARSGLAAAETHMLSP